MANKVFNMAGGKHSAAAYSAFENAMYGSCVASDSDFVATAGTGMNVSLSKGNGLIDTGLDYARRIQSDATQTIAISAASSANPRKDAIVAYIDNSVSPSTSYTDNTNNILKFISVDGTPAANPSAPSAATIQTAVGAGNPYVVLWHVLVPKSATSLTAATFTRACPIAKVDIPAGTISTTMIKNSAVNTNKIDWSTIVGTITEGDPVSSGYIDLGSIRIQWKNNRYSSLNTGAGGYNTITDSFPVAFKNTTYSVVVSETSDTGNVAGGNFKVVSKTSSGVTLNYNHTGSIGNSVINYSIIAIGLKP